MLKVRIPGTRGKMNGGDAPTIGLLGRLGGIEVGVRKESVLSLTVMVLSVQLLLQQNFLICRTKEISWKVTYLFPQHICPDAPTAPHDPVPFMGSPVEMSQVNREEVSPELDAILSVDTTKGNRVINTRGFAISPTVKEGYIFKNYMRIFWIYADHNRKTSLCVPAGSAGYHTIWK